MNYKKVSEIYRQTNAATISVVEYVRLLLSEVLSNMQLYENSEGTEDVHTRNRILSKAQELLLELMSTTNRKSEEGERLFTFYGHLNQCIIELRLNESIEMKAHINEQLGHLIDAWQEAQQTSRLQKYQTPWI